MANDGTIASKLQLDGEQQYKKALNDAYRSLRVLKSELKAETAELGRNATQQDKARAKMQSLQKQIAEQQKIVKTLEKALADSRKEYADNQEVQDKWAEKLNKAREALANMQNQMGACQDSLEKFSGSMKDVADNSGEAMTTVISFNDAMRSIGNIASGIGDSLSGIFSATVDTMKDMVDEMFSLMSMAWSAAGDWQQIQTIWGGDLESIEKVYTGMQLQGVDASQVTSGIQKFISNVHNGNKDTMAALEQLHLSEDQFSSHWDFFVAVMDKASMFKGKDGNNLMTALFGDKKGAGMTDVLANWRDAMNKYQQDVEETGLHLYDDEIKKLDEVSHKITEIQELWNTIKTNIGAKLSDVLNMDQLSDDALEVMRTFAAMMNSDEESKAELTVKLNDSIEKLLEDIGAAMENLGGWIKELGGDLEKSDNPFIQFIGKLIKSLGDILDWLGENSGTIIEWLNRLLPVMAANKISEATTGKGLGDWLTDIVKIGVEFKVLGKVFGSTAGSAIGETAATFGTGIGAALIKAVPWMAGLIALITPSEGKDEIGDNTLIDKNGQLTNEAIEYGYALDENGRLIPPTQQYEHEIENYSPIPEIEESIDLPDAVYSLADKVNAIQDWWDANLNYQKGLSDENEEINAFKWMVEVLGDEFGTFWDRYLQESEGKDLSALEDIPADWYANISAALKNLSQDNYRGTADENLPMKIASAVAGAVKNVPISVNVYVGEEQIGQSADKYMGSLMSRLYS